MIKNYLNYALRLLKQNKVFAGINILGLIIALTASFIIILFVINELSYNRCHKNKNLVYRLINYNDEYKTTEANTPFALASALKEEYPQVIKAINTRWMQGFSIRNKEDKFSVSNVLASGSEIFNIFTFTLISGINTEDLLDDKYSICLSCKLAEKLFSETDIVGNEIAVFINNEKHIFIVTSVFENIVDNSTFRADCLINSFWGLDDINKTFEINNVEKSWTHEFWTTWVLLKPGSDIDLIESQFRTLETKYIGLNSTQHYSLQSLSDVYLKSDHIQNTGIKGNMSNVRLLSVIAFLIILVATINYIILSTAVSMSRTKEIGIRKTFGARNNQIKHQFLIESVLLTAIVLPAAFVLMMISLPYAGELFQTQLYILKSNIVLYVSVYLALTLLIGIASGFYTSAWLSRLKVIHLLKPSILKGRKKNFFRSSLIIVQLIIFCFFVTCTLIIRSQHQYILKKNPGFHNENILLMSLGSCNCYTSLLNEIRTNPNIIMAAGTMTGLPMDFSMSLIFPHFQDKELKIRVEGFSIDYNFLQTMGIPVIEGRDFSKSFGTDLTNSCILNETAVKQLGLTHPFDKQLGPYTIIGVVKDFNLHSFHTEIPPLMIFLTKEYIQQIAIHYSPGSLNTLLPMLEKSWLNIVQEQPFHYLTVENLIEKLYSEEKNMSVIISIFAFFTLLISSFGLFGLTLFISRNRSKEIVIKKVLGCSATSIIYSFMRMNILYVLIASVISIPIVFIVMSKWLSNYSSRIEIKWWFFVLTFIIAAIVILSTVFIHSFKASRINPAKALRYE